MSVKFSRESYVPDLEERIFVCYADLICFGTVQNVNEENRTARIAWVVDRGIPADQAFGHLFPISFLPRNLADGGSARKFQRQTSPSRRCRDVNGAELSVGCLVTELVPSANAVYPRIGLIADFPDQGIQAKVFWDRNRFGVVPCISLGLLSTNEHRDPATVASAVNVVPQQLGDAAFITLRSSSIQEAVDRLSNSIDFSRTSEGIEFWDQIIWRLTSIGQASMYQEQASCDLQKRFFRAQAEKGR